MQVQDTFDEDTQKESVSELQPLYLMLASSLNVELVYVILKSITQFCYLTYDSKTGAYSLSKSSASISVDKETGDAVTEFSKIKVKNSQEWEARRTMNQSI